jgi:hypothetical protein
MKRLTLKALIALLMVVGTVVAPAPAVAQEPSAVSANGSWIEYRGKGSTFSGGTITCGAAGTPCIINSPYTGAAAPSFSFESAQAAGAADSALPAYRFDVSSNLGSGDFHSTWRDNNTSALMWLRGDGVLFTNSDVRSATGSAGSGQLSSTGLLISSRLRIASSADNIATITGTGATDLDTMNLGPATPADIGAVTLASTNTGTAGFVIVSNTAASGAVDTGITLRTVGDMGTSDFPLIVEDNNGTALFRVAGGGTITATSSIISSNAIFPTLSTRSYIQSPTDGSMLFSNNSSTDIPFYIRGTAKTLTESSATDVVLVEVASGSGTGGDFEYAVYAADATNHQIRSGRVIFNAVNEAGNETCVLGTLEELDNTPTGTLTAAISCVTTPTNGVMLQINAASSLTQTTLNVEWQLRKSNGTGGVVPQ